MKSEWDAKLFLHNTPHCIAAFLGYFKNCTYLHEALDDDDILNTLEGVVGEILQTLKDSTFHDHSFMEKYAEKEISRFSNKLLYDPVSRVAREPLRKLAIHGRLVGALRMALRAGIVPTYITKGISAALKYNNPQDPDYPKILMVDTMGVANFLYYYLDLDRESIESKLICDSYSNF